MPPTVDPAILKALSLTPSTATLDTHGSSGFASSFKLSTKLPDGTAKHFFVKIASGKDAELMFEGEHASLNAIHDAVPNFCPRSYANGKMSSGTKSFLVTDFLDLGARSPSGSGESLAHKLAKLHTTEAPAPEGYDKPMFGFPVSTCCGDTPQDNSFKSTWTEFYAENRLRSIYRAAAKNHGPDKEVANAVEKTADKVVPRLIGAVKDIKPVIVHGDLWSGNHSTGQIGGEGGVEEVVFDPSSVYGHSEYELGIMKMFGGFGSAFFKEYEKLVPRAEPRDEYEDRIALYEL